MKILIKGILDYGNS